MRKVGETEEVEVLEVAKVIVKKSEDSERMS